DERGTVETSTVGELGDWRGVPEATSARTEYRFRGPAAAGVHLDDAEDFSERPQLEVPTSVAEAGATADLSGADDRGGEGAAGAEDAATAAWPPAERGAPDLAGLEAELSRELEPDYGDHDADGWEESGDEPEKPAPVAAAAVIAPEHGMRPPPRPAPPPRTGSRRGLMTAAAVLVVVLVGGATAFYLRAFDQGPSGPPPVIAAPQGPVKIEPAPAESAGGEETVGEAVYNRVAGGAPTAEENVVEGAEEPQELARIVLPPSEGESAAGGPIEGEAPEATAEPGQPAEEAEGSAEEFGPRRVPTYVVRPDGTIVATAEAGASTVTGTGEDLATAQTEAMDPKPVETVTIDEPRTAGTPASPRAAEGPVAATELASPPAAPAEESELAAVDVPEEPTPTPAAPIVEEVEEPVVAVAPTPEPAAPPPTAASGFLVQISSQTSQEAAQTTFANLQQRYPAILGSLQADIQQADLGPKGIYFRVRVGPWAERTDAVEVCEALQTAGGDCFVTQ
ncbi:MAG: SPOR domain-containing protein, partial [Propylenella sp.]